VGSEETEAIMTRRSETRIIREILYVCGIDKEGAGKTRIVYQANLNFKTAKPWLNKLLDLKAIELVGDKYRITAKGLALCRQLRKLPKELGGNSVAKRDPLI